MNKPLEQFFILIEKDMNVNPMFKASLPKPQPPKPKKER